MTVAHVPFGCQSVRAEGDAAARRGLLELAARLLPEDGPQALTLPTLTQRANCSTKVVYTLSGGTNGLGEGLKVEGFGRLRFAIERERRRHRDAVQVLPPVVMTYRSFALTRRSLFGVMFGNALPEHVPTDYSRQEARPALGAVESAVAEARMAPDQSPHDAREAPVRPWAAVHGPVTVVPEDIRPFTTTANGWRDWPSPSRSSVCGFWIHPPAPGGPPMDFEGRIRAASSAAASVPDCAVPMATSGSTPARSRDAGATSMHLDMPALREAEGTPNCRLFLDAAIFPDRAAARPVRGTIAELSDEDGNDRRFSGVLGLPADGCSGTDDRTDAPSGRKWDEPRFIVERREPASRRVTRRDGTGPARRPPDGLARAATPHPKNTVSIGNRMMVHMERPATSHPATLITGGGTGIGLEMARLLAARGHRLALASRDGGRLRCAPDELRQSHHAEVHVHAVDPSVPGCPQTLFEHTGARGAAHRRLGERRRIRRAGCILDIASTAAFQPTPDFAAHGAAKAFVLKFSEALAKEMEDHGAGVHCLTPGPTDTAFFGGVDPPRIGGSHHFGKAGRADPRDVAAAGAAPMRDGGLTRVAGLANRVTVLGSRLAPRATVPALSERLSRPLDPRAAKP